MSSTDEDDAIVAIEADDPMTDEETDDKADTTEHTMDDDDDDDDDGGSNSVPLASLRKRARLDKAAKAAVAPEEEEVDDQDRNECDDDNTDKTDDERPSFATALGLHRVGSKLPVRPQPQPPVQVLNARGMPARIRKKNKLFFDDNIVNDRPLRTSPSKRATAAQQTAATLNTSSRSTVAAAAAVAAAATASQPRKLTPKKGKGVVSRYMKLKEETKKKREAAAAATASIAIAETEKLLSGRAGRLSGAAAAASADGDPSTGDESMSMVDRASYERTGRRLRNLLKLPKAHKWVSYEWFYSYIDRPLFDGPNDFEICLRETFPDLKTRHLSRPEWSYIRLVMGKPRRCSTAFFAEERAELERRRHKIRTLQSTRRQQQLSSDAEYTRNLPAEVPLALPVGTKVTARLRYPSDGLFIGTVAAVDPLTSTYRITFDKQGLGTHSVPDFEIMANDYAEMLPLVSQQQLQLEAVAAAAAAAKQNRLSRNNAATARQQAHQTNRNDPLLGSEIFNNSTLKALVGGDAQSSSMGGAPAAAAAEPKVGGFHYKLLELIIRTRRSLAAKELKLLRQKNMNDEATLIRSFDEPLTDDFQRRYASVVIGMEKLNRDMQDNLAQIQSFTGDLAKDPSVAATMEPSYMRERCKELALETVKKNNTDVVKSDHMMRMIHDLATIMWVASNMKSAADDSSSTTDRSHVHRVLEVCLSESRARLVDPANEHAFRQHVEVHMRHLENDLRKGGDAQLGAP